MFWKNLKLAFRNLRRNPRTSIINITGLTFGIVLTILIFLIVSHEITYDNYHEKKDHIYRICTKPVGGTQLSLDTPLPTPYVLRKDYPEVRMVTSFWPCVHEMQTKAGEFFNCTGYSVEPEVFDMFNFKMLMGDPKKSLSYPGSAIVTKSFAGKISGDTSAIGTTIQIRGYHFTVTGIMNDPPPNSIFNFDLLLSDKIRTKAYPNWEERWWESSLKTFALLHEHTDINAFNEKLKKIPEKYFPEFLIGRETFSSYPFSNSHISEIKGDMKPTVSPKYLYMLIAIALAVLVLACINFANMATSRISQKSKETGIRKVTGAKRNQLVFQYLSESFLAALIALFLSFILVELLMPKFVQLTGKEIRMFYGDYRIILGILGIGFIAAFMSGIYPGLYLSRFGPIEVLRMKHGKMPGRSPLRQSFVVTQFIITIGLIIFELVILKQIFYMKNADVGIQRNNLLSISAPNNMHNTNLFVRKVEERHFDLGVKQFSITENLPGHYFQNSFEILPKELKGTVIATVTSIDSNYLRVFDREMMAGRFFSHKFADDGKNVIINQTAMRAFGWNTIEDKYIKFKHDQVERKVLGVIRDAHLQSLKNEKGPVVYRFGENNSFPGFITFQIQPDRTSETLKAVSKQWKALFPNIPLDYYFIDDLYAKQYQEEEKLAKIVGIFSSLAILLSSIGLLGLVIFMAEQRTKEIGIRKVNGAKVNDILILLNKDFVRWIALASLVAIPFAYYGMEKWLQNFAYKTQLSWWIFALAIVLILSISMLTVSFQSWRAARQNPVDSLRYE